MSDKYIAFLRGINISGKNKISMADLKVGFEEAGFSDVSTFLNSGNVVFSAETDAAKPIIEKMISDKFGLEISVYVIKKDYLQEILSHSPEWWGLDNNDKYDNLIFILSSDSAEEIYDLLGEPSEGLERVKIYENVIFWTFDRQSYRKCNWWKRTACAPVADKLTIRTANTVKKVCKQEYRMR